MSIVAIIPARGGSKGIPNKNIIDFCGKPLIAWSIEAATGSKYIDDVYVSTDNQKIAEISAKYGAKMINRPEELSMDTSIADEAILHALDCIKADYEHIDMIVFIQATSPVRVSKNIDEAIELFILKKADSLFSACLLEDYCIWSMNDSVKKSITYDYKNRGNRQDRNPYILENGSFYIMTPALIKKEKNRLGGKIEIYEMPFWMSYEIDSESDLEVCEFFMKKLLKSGGK